MLVGASLAMAACGGGGKQTQDGSTTTSTEKAPEIPLEDFFKTPQRSQYRLSPDGKLIAYAAPWHGRKNIYVLSAQSPADSGKRITAETDRDLAGFSFANNNTITFSKDFGGDENFHIFTVRADGSGQKDVTPYPKVRASIVDDLPEDDAHMLISMNKRNPEEFDVYKLNVDNGQLAMVAQNPGKAEGWVTDNDGKIRACVQSDGVNQSLLYREVESQPFRKLLTTSFKEQVSPQGFDATNKMMYVSSNRGRDKSAAFEFDPQTAKEGKLIYENPDVDVAGMEYSRRYKKLVAVHYEDAKEQVKWLDDSYAALDKAVVAALGTADYWIGSHDKAEENFIIQTYGDRTGGVIYHFNASTGKASKLAERMPWLKKQQLAEMKPITYKSRDGMTINGYLTLPVGMEAKNLPVVVNPHGGPWARDSWGFNPEIQFLANRGYAVLQMNFRGSTGYGRQFWEASFKQWGKKMQDDVTDGVEYLKKEGIADPKRVAIYGGSYGGYATLAGLAFTPDVYACGVDYVGVSNMFTFMKTIPPYWKPFMAMMYEMAGDPVKDSLLLAEVSPALHVDKIKAPLFVAQGRNDPRVNVDESDQIVNNLKKRGVTVQYMVKDNEGHGFHNEENRFDFYRAMEKFLGEHIGAKKEVAGK